jgi:hypothetical protein
MTYDADSFGVSRNPANPYVGNLRALAGQPTGQLGSSFQRERGTDSIWSIGRPKISLLSRLLFARGLEE